MARTIIDASRVLPYAPEDLCRLVGDVRVYPEDNPNSATAPYYLEHVRQILAKAVDEGGTSFDEQYKNVNGESGYFSQELNAYGREDEPCDRCGSIIVREAFANRSSFRCPRCQRKPRTI